MLSSDDEDEGPHTHECAFVPGDTTAPLPSWERTLSKSGLTKRDLDNPAKVQLALRRASSSSEEERAALQRALGEAERDLLEEARLMSLNEALKTKDEALRGLSEERDALAGELARLRSLGERVPSPTREQYEIGELGEVLQLVDGELAQRVERLELPADLERSLLGEGHFGRVFPARHPEHGLVVVKRMKKEAEGGGSDNVQEAQLLELFMHAKVAATNTPLRHKHPILNLPASLPQP